MILVATGNPDTDNSQVLDVSTTSTTCSNLPAYPLSLHCAVGGIVDGSVIMCGGLLTSGYPPQTCYRFEKNTNSWKLHCNMQSKRFHHASVVMKNALFITGGYDGNFNMLASTEYVYSNGTVQSGPDLPMARNGHCQVTLHDGKVMIMGARSPTSLDRNVIVMDPADNSFSTGPSLNYIRQYAACCVFNSDLHEGRPVVFSAGGNGQATVEVYDYTTTNQWQTSIHFIISNIDLISIYFSILIVVESLPTTHTSDFHGLKALPSTTGNGVYVQWAQHLYEMTCTSSSCTWSVMEQKLSPAVRWPVMMYLPSDYTCTN